MFLDEFHLTTITLISLNLVLHLSEKREKSIEFAQCEVVITSDTIIILGTHYCYCTAAEQAQMQVKIMANAEQMQ